MSRAAEIIKRKIEITELEIEDWKETIEEIVDEGRTERMLTAIPIFLKFIEQNCAEIKVMRKLLEEIVDKDEISKSE